MQLSQIYSNLDHAFSPIVFNAGAHANILNVVFATVKHKRERARDSHNLGKTTLIHLIDFLLLRRLGGQSHFLERSAERFSNFVFFLEIALNDGGFVTVRRSVSQPTKISLKRSEKKNQDCRSLADEDWDHNDVPLDTARTLLDAYLNLTVVRPWQYRKGVSYFLRTQEDYSDFFQIQKFKEGKDREWKPYLAGILGLDHEAVHQKYVVDDRIDEAAKRRDEKKAEIAPDLIDRGQLVTRIEIARDEIQEIETRLDGFDFQEEERRINKRVVNEVEAKISDINDDLYNIEADMSQLERSLRGGIKFDLGKIREIYEESRIAIPEAITKSYEELVEFNRALTKERNAALRSQLKELEAKKGALNKTAAELNTERQHLLKIVRDADTFRKYKSLQGELSTRRAALIYLEGQLSRVDEVEKLELTLRDLRGRRDECITKIEETLRNGSATKTAVTQLFNRYVKQVLSINGQFIVSKNKSGNLEFEIKTTDALGIDTNQKEGHSYKKLLCALFDVAVLKALENKPFYHFVYHDGIFEGLDNRKKLNVLDFIREIIADGKIEYIISVIESDLPRAIDGDEQQIQFSDSEIVLTLNDLGDQGRLFKMPPF